MAFNEKLKELRTGLDLTQKEFAQKIGLSAASIIAYERNEKKPSYDVLLSISEKFNVSLDWLCREKANYEYKTVKWSDLLYLVYSILKNEHVPVDVQNCTESRSGANAVGLIFAEYLLDLYDLTDTYQPYKISNEKYNVDDLTAFTNPIYEFITTYKNMKDLLNSGSITQSLFDLWLSDTFSKNDKLIWTPHK